LFRSKLRGKTLKENLYDFGSIFARAPRAVPNIYGPIALVFSPRCFGRMQDICITQQSILSLGEAWRSCAIDSKDGVDALLQGDGFGSPIAKDWEYAELSCSNRTLHFDDLEEILVEPMLVEGSVLLELMKEEAGRAGVTCPIKERIYRSLANRIALRDLVATCERLAKGLAEENWTFSETDLPAAFAKVPQKRKGSLCGWCRYFYFGTLGEIRRDREAWDSSDDRTICEICDPGEERPPALVEYSPLDDGDQVEPRVDVGHCDWCNGVSVRCRDCGLARAVPKYEYGEVLECPGGCGLRFTVGREYEPRGGGGDFVEILTADAEES
jgi:hypothetical protein